MSLARKHLLLPARELTGAPAVELQRFVNAGRLAASVAYELLSAIGLAQTDMGFVCDQLEDGPPVKVAPHVRDAACDARAAITRAISRVNSVLSLARSRRGKIAPLDLREVIGAALFELEARLAGFEVSTDLSAASFALAERGALLQTLVSLLLDAAEASPPRGRIALSLRADLGGVIIDIDDEGAAPILPESLPDREVTPLWLSRNVVRSFGGELTAALGPLGGRRVSVRLRTTRAE
jgi:C4-dicarboxylate-specific signal transduction histidine kinase